MRISLIVAMGKARQIGLKNDLPWRLPEDLKMFKKRTMGHSILMGRNTFESIGKPLPGRTSLIISRSADISKNTDTCFWFTTPEDAINWAQEKGEEELFICGGGQIYSLLINKAERFYISEVDYDGPADAFFPTFNEDSYSVLEETTYPKTEKTLGWTFKVLTK